VYGKSIDLLLIVRVNFSQYRLIQWGSLLEVLS
jgi:hypothetical protein